jgi:hypothetical protein
MSKEAGKEGRQALEAAVPMLSDAVRGTFVNAVRGSYKVSSRTVSDVSERS